MMLPLLSIFSSLQICSLLGTIVETFLNKFLSYIRWVLKWCNVFVSRISDYAIVALAVPYSSHDIHHVSIYYLPSSSLCGGESVIDCCLFTATVGGVSFSFIPMRPPPQGNYWWWLMNASFYFSLYLSSRNLGWSIVFLLYLLWQVCRIRPQFWTKTCLSLTYLPCTIPFHRHRS